MRRRAIDANATTRPLWSSPLAPLLKKNTGARPEAGRSDNACRAPLSPHVKKTGARRIVMGKKKTKEPKRSKSEPESQGSISPRSLSDSTDTLFNEANGQELKPIPESPAHYSRPSYGSLAALHVPRLGACSSSSDRFSVGEYSLDRASLDSDPVPRDSRRERKPKKRFWSWLCELRGARRD